MFQYQPAPARRELSLAVVGLAYPNRDKSSRRFEAELCAPGDRVELHLEPKNPKDPRAIAVASAARSCRYARPLPLGWKA